MFQHSTRVAVIRYFVSTGKLPRDWYDLNTELGTRLTLLSTPLYEVQGVVPESVYAALSFVGA
ncbi:hypothetical protein B0G38_000867 [Arthrobacter sp. VKM Ac-2550]|nr:hypothetical protein [Arthrobacter sp. VKM Ac-2550]